jgi:hypothetical protein
MTTSYDALLQARLNARARLQARASTPLVEIRAYEAGLDAYAGILEPSTLGINEDGDGQLLYDNLSVLISTPPPATRSSPAEFYAAGISQLRVELEAIRARVNNDATLALPGEEGNLGRPPQP